MCLFYIVLLLILLVLWCIVLHWAEQSHRADSGCNAFVKILFCGNETRQDKVLRRNGITTTFKHEQGRLERLQDERDALKMQVKTRKYADRRDQVRWG